MDDECALYMEPRNVCYIIVLPFVTIYDPRMAQIIIRESIIIIVFRLITKVNHTMSYFFSLFLINAYTYIYRIVFVIHKWSVFIKRLCILLSNSAIKASVQKNKSTHARNM